MRYVPLTCLWLSGALIFAGCGVHDGPERALPVPLQRPATPVQVRVEAKRAQPDAAAGLAEFSVAGFLSGSMVSDGAGNEWSAGQGTLVRFNERTHAFKQFALPDSGYEPFGLAVDPSGGRIWFAVPNVRPGRVGYIDLNTGFIQTFKTPTHAAEPFGIALGPDNAMWFSESKIHAGATGSIGRIDLTSFAITEYSLPSTFKPTQIALGSDGALWFGAYAGNGSSGSIGRITTGGQIATYSIGGNIAYGITAGPDGATWFTGTSDQSQGSFVGRIDLATHKRTLYKYSAGSGGNVAIVARDADLWMTVLDKHRIDRFDLSTHVIHARTLPLGYYNPLGLALGTDHELWFTNYGPSSAAVGKLCPGLSDNECATSQ